MAGGAWSECSYRAEASAPGRRTIVELIVVGAACSATSECTFERRSRGVSGYPPPSARRASHAASMSTRTWSIVLTPSTQSSMPA